MKILHSSDWHLGKNLEGQSRLEEQARFLDDFVKIVEENEIDVVVIAGDIYDSGNPPAKAEQLFYDTLVRLSQKGERLILIIAGNHDSPERLTAAGPLAKKHGIVIAGTPKTVIEAGDYGQHKVIRSGEGFIEIEVKGERAVVLLVPFPSEKRLNEFLYDTMSEEEEKQQSYNDRIKELFGQLGKEFRKDTINLIVSHLFVSGTKESGSERSLTLGGSYLADSSCFPKEAQYIALGHIHRMQVVPGTNKKARYAGAPMHFNRKEIPYSNKVLKVELEVGKEAEITEIDLLVYKPIEVWRCKSFAEARNRCMENQDKESFVYLEIQTDTFISEEQIKELKQYKKDLLEITPIFPEQLEQEKLEESEKERTFSDLFQEFYQREVGVAPSEELVELLFSILGQEEESHETDTFEN